MLRYIAILAVLVTFLGTLFAAGGTLSILGRSAALDASAIQVTQIHSEAQTQILFGMFSLLAVIALGVLMPPREQKPIDTETKPPPAVSKTE